MTIPAALTAERAAFRYAGKTRTVGPFDLQVAPGEIHLVCGPSGCGKSTLARMLSGAIPHLYRGRLEGRVLLGDRGAADFPLWQLSTRVGLMSQNPAAQLLTGTVREEIIFGLENLGLGREEIEQRLDETLASFCLEPLAERDPRTLSGGEQQRLVLAATAARRPEALVLDEPLSMLDTASAKQIVAAVDRLRAAGSAVVAFEHREGAFAQLDGVKRERLSGAERDLGPLPDLKTRVPAFRVVLDDVGVELGQRAVLRHLDLALAGGQVWAIVGANGAGKTTLLRTLAGLQRHSGRTVGYATGGHPLPRLGLCFQNPDRQIFNPTVRQEILFGCDEPDLAFYDDVVELLGLTAYQDTPPLLLSEGEKKRLGLAIMLLRPGLSGICLDEPTLGQDEYHRRLLGEIVRRLAGAGYLCVVATHDLEWATRWCDQLLLLQEGQIAAVADPASARRQPEIWTRGGLLLPESCTPCQRQSLSL